MALTLDNTNSYLEELINVGADAMSNLYYLRFLGGKFSDYDVTSGILVVRASLITLPKFTHTTNTVNFMTVSADMPKAEITGKKEISITFRLDANYSIYEALLAQQKLTSIPDLGYAATVVPEEVNTSSFTIRLYSMSKAVSSEDQETRASLLNEESYQKLYEFNYCWIKSIERPKFSYDNANAQTITVKIGFYNYKDPQSFLLEETTSQDE